MLEGRLKCVGVCDPMCRYVRYWPQSTVVVHNVQCVAVLECPCLCLCLCVTLTITRWQNDSFELLGSPLSDYFGKRILFPSIVVGRQVENYPSKGSFGSLVLVHQQRPQGRRNGA